MDDGHHPILDAPVMDRLQGRTCHWRGLVPRLIPGDLWDSGLGLRPGGKVSGQNDTGDSSTAAVASCSQDPELNE